MTQKYSRKARPCPLCPTGIAICRETKKRKDGTTFSTLRCKECGARFRLENGDDLINYELPTKPLGVEPERDYIYPQTVFEIRGARVIKGKAQSGGMK